MLKLIATTSKKIFTFIPNDNRYYGKQNAKIKMMTTT